MCHIVQPEDREGLVVSLTQVLPPRSMPLSAAVAAYQKHRIKKAKEAGTELKMIGFTNTDILLAAQEARSNGNRYIIWCGNPL